MSNKRIPRKKGQHRGSSSHSDLYTDENPKGTIKGLKFATVKDAKASVGKINGSGKSHAHKIQAAVAMEQRAKEMGKVSAAGVYRTFINKMKKKTKKKNENTVLNHDGKAAPYGSGYEKVEELITKMVSEVLEEIELDEKCQKGYKTHPTRKTKKMFGKRYRNCVKAEEKTEEGWSDKYKKSINCSNPKGFSQKAHCDGKKKRQESKMSLKLEELVGKTLTEEQFDEAAGEKDACYYKVKARYDVWPSAYASGALVKCRKVGAKNWGNKSKKKESYDIYNEKNGKGLTLEFNEPITEAEYQGRTVQLNKPMQGDTKKFKVYVNSGKKNKDGTIKVKKVEFGAKGMRIKKSNPERRKSFRARHNCDSPGPKTKARYWSCKKW
tara:strand:- start:8424 stop:9566 length:1143 start_codon:yes stop_codon:yes gene_type:complete